jgi:hypothetical protein
MNFSFSLHLAHSSLFSDRQQIYSPIRTRPQRRYEIESDDHRMELSSKIGQRYLGIKNTRQKNCTTGGEGGGGGDENGGSDVDGKSDGNSDGGRTENHRACDKNNVNEEKIENSKSNTHSIDDRMELVLDVLNDDLIEQCRKKILGEQLWF